MKARNNFYWPSFLLFAGARREHRIVSPLLQTYIHKRQFLSGSLLKVITKGKKTPNLDYVIHGWSVTYLYGFSSAKFVPNIRK